MKNKEQNENYINMNKDELIKLLNSNYKIIKKKITAYNTLYFITGLTLIVLIFMLAGVIAVYPHTKDLNLLSSILKSNIIVGLIPTIIAGVLTLAINHNINKQYVKISDIKKQLENIVTMDYEKERYKTDIEHKEKIESLEKDNELGKISIDEYYNVKIKNDLIKFKEELEKLKLDNNIVEINSEIRHYKGKKTILADKKIRLLIKEYKKDNN